MDWYDTNGDGWLDTGIADTNADGYYDTVAVDRNLDGYVDGWSYDTNGDGYIDTVMDDSNEDGYADSEGWDVDADGDLDYYADASTGWQAVAVYDAPTTMVIGPSDGTSTVDILNGLPVDDLYTRIVLDGIISDINATSGIWASPW